MWNHATARRASYFGRVLLTALWVGVWLGGASPAPAQTATAPIDADLRPVVYNGCVLLTLYRAPPELAPLQRGAYRELIGSFGERLGGQWTPTAALLNALQDERVASSIDCFGGGPRGVLAYRVTRYRDAKTVADLLAEWDAEKVEGGTEEGEPVRVISSGPYRQRLTVWRLDERTLVEGSDDAVAEAIKAAKRQGAGVASILSYAERAPAGADVVAVFNTGSYRSFAQQVLTQIKSFAPPPPDAVFGPIPRPEAPPPMALPTAELFIDSEWFTAALQLNQLRGVVKIEPAPGVTVARVKQHAEPVLAELKKEWARLRETLPAEFIQEQPEVASALFTTAQEMIDSLAVSEKPDHLRATFVASTTLAEITAALDEPVQAMKSGLVYTKMITKLREFAYARNDFPGRGSQTRAIRNSAGKPLLSWRVRLLELTDYRPLYERFKLDEPWDSPHNIRLVSEMPEMFESPGVKLEPGKTVWAMPMGKGTRFPDAITEAPLDAVYIDIVELAPEKAVVWTKPDDWIIDPKAPMAGLNASRGGLYVGYFNRAAELIPATFDQQEFLKLVAPSLKD